MVAFWIVRHIFAEFVYALLKWRRYREPNVPDSERRPVSEKTLSLLHNVSISQMTK